MSYSNFNKQKAFTLIELMIVIAIIGILASVAVPQYNTYQKRARFSEVIMATTVFKTPAEIAVHSGRATNIAGLNSSSHGIPEDIVAGEAVGSYVSTVDISNGLITATGTAAVSNAVYRLQGTITQGGLRWQESEVPVNSCQNLGLC